MYYSTSFHGPVSSAELGIFKTQQICEHSPQPRNVYYLTTHQMQHDSGLQYRVSSYHFDSMPIILRDSMPIILLLSAFYHVRYESNLGSSQQTCKLMKPSSSYLSSRFQHRAFKDIRCNYVRT